MENIDLEKFIDKDVPHFGDGWNYMVSFVPDQSKTIRQIHKEIEEKSGYKLSLYISSGWCIDNPFIEKYFDLNGIKKVNLLMEVKSEKLTGKIATVRYDLWGD